MIDREVTEKIKQYARQYPVVNITGPRQSGKTTLCQTIFDHKEYVSLEDIDGRSSPMVDTQYNGKKVNFCSSISL